MKAKLKSKTEFTLTFEPELMPNIEIGKYFVIKPYKKNRSLEQNSYMWAIIQEISKETGQDAFGIYTSGLEYTGILIEWIETIPEAEDTLKRVYRIVKKVENRVNSKGKKTCLFKCYVGSSLFKTNEMKILIDFFINLADEMDINIENIEMEK
jgi:hypothetical protein